MVCNRCIMAVKQAFEKEGITPVNIGMGEVELNQLPEEDQFNKIKESLMTLGFEILDDQKQKLIETVKSMLIEKVQSVDIEEHFILSEYISQKLYKEYSQVSRLFSEVEGITIEQFFIQQKIEKVKELIAYDELTLSEIAWKLGYSSVAHLSAQFKKVTGFTPSHIKKLEMNTRKPLDDL
jgi:AraC family transcriptional regulator